MRNKITIKEPNNWVPAQDMEVNQFGVIREVEKKEYIGKIIGKQWAKDMLC